MAKPTPPTSPVPTDTPSNFIREVIEADLAANRHGGRVVTRFPPEPNGYLHIGHAKAICIDFDVAADVPGHRCHLRFDDTNPVKEDTEYVEAIQRDVQWLGFSWGETPFFSSDYFERLYQFAEELIEAGLAYVCSLPEEQARQMRGSITEPGQLSPDRERSAADSLALFRRMRAGEFKDGELVLRAKIDMAAANMKMRDPAIYRIRHTSHHRTGDEWCIYPLYDFTHCLSDSLEGITHSLCTVEFESARELYDWVLDHLKVPARPRQYEFAPLSLTYVVLSKRKLRKLVEEGTVAGWDDPRMPTLSGLRRRGYLPEAIRSFVASLGVSKNRALTDLGRLEQEQRNALNPTSKRVLAVLDPLPITITNMAVDEVIELDAPDFPEDVGIAGSRTLLFGSKLLIERADFMQRPSKKFKRLAPGREVRLRHAFVLRCTDVVCSDGGEVLELKCTIDRKTQSRPPEDGRKVGGTIHWVSARHSLPCEVRVIDRLFTVEQPDTPDGPDFTAFLNPESLQVFSKARVEPSIAEYPADARYQFERQGFFWQDPQDSAPDSLVFNRIVSLKDSWQKIAQAEESGKSAEQARQESRSKERQAKKKAQAAADRQRGTQVSGEAQSLAKEHGIAAEQAQVLTSNAELLDLFEQALSASQGGAQCSPKTLAGIIVSELPRRLKTSLERPVGPAQLAALTGLIDQGTVSARAGKELMAAMWETGKEPAQLVDELGLRQVSDEAALTALLQQIMDQFPEKVAAYRAGNKNLAGLFVGQMMQRSKGQADPKVVARLVGRLLDAD